MRAGTEALERSRQEAFVAVLDWDRDQGPDAVLVDVILDGIGKPGYGHWRFVAEYHDREVMGKIIDGRIKIAGTANSAPAIREWAIDEGFDVGARGALKDAVVNAYFAAVTS